MKLADITVQNTMAAAGLLSREEHRARFSALRAKVEKAVKEAESEQTNNGGPAFPVADLAWLGLSRRILTKQCVPRLAGPCATTSRRRPCSRRGGEEK